jgi:hypothetical protein
MRRSIVRLSTLVAFAVRAFALSDTAAAAPAQAPASAVSDRAAGAPPTGEPPLAPTTNAPGPSASLTAAAPALSMRGASVWGILPWGGIGAGARFTMQLRIPPLLRNTSIRDNFSLEFGADILRWTYGQDTLFSSSYTWTEVLPVVGMSWNLWFNDALALYPKLESGYAFGWLSNTAYGSAGYGGVFVNGAAGLLYKLESGLTLRAEAGYSGLKVGAGWLF